MKIPFIMYILPAPESQHVVLSKYLLNKCLPLWNVPRERGATKGDRVSLPFRWMLQSCRHWSQLPVWKFKSIIQLHQMLIHLSRGAGDPG